MSDDHIIWDLKEGSKIRALRNLHEELNPELPCWFTEGAEYPIESMHPIADPPFVKVKTNEGHTTKLYAKHIKADFCRV